MRLRDFQTIDTDNERKVIFLRVDPEDYTVTLAHILGVLSDLSWINQFDVDYIKSSYRIRAQATVDYLCEKLKNEQDDPVTENTGEYIVSEVAREAIIASLKYKDIPLAELFREQVASNPGFDFYSQTIEEIVVFGEAKYLSKQNAYGSGMKQITRFIKEKRDLADLADLQNFFSIDALNKASQGNKAFSVAFSSKKTLTSTLIKHIKAHRNYSELAEHRELIFVAVDI